MRRMQGAELLSEDQRAIPDGIKTFIVNRADFYPQMAPVDVLRNERVSELREDGKEILQLLRAKKLTQSSEVSERSAFLLLYPYGDHDQIFHMENYLTARINSISPSDDDQDQLEFRKLT